MIVSRYRNTMAALGLILLFLSLSPCPAGDPGSLEAAPWISVADSAVQLLPGIPLGGLMSDLAPGDFIKLQELAKEGNPLAAGTLAGYSRYELEDAGQAVRWLRVAVKNGAVSAALELGRLYFPAEGTLGREDLDHKPDAVLGYAWYAIGLSGLKMLAENDGEERTSLRRTQELVDGLRMLLLPSERVRAAAILSKWPEEMPPDTPLEPMPDQGGQGRIPKIPAAAAAPLDEKAVVEIVRQRVFGGTGNAAVIASLFRPSPELEQVLRKAFEQMRLQADAGDEEAEFMVAWCRFHGLGTEADEDAAMSVLEARAAAGYPEACFLMAAWTFERGDGDGEERAFDMAVRAAEKGHVRAMLLLSGIWRERGDKGQAARWMEKAAETGSFPAIEEMLGFAESAGDWKGLVRWLTVLMIRAPDPAMAYRCRMLIAYVGSGADEEELQAAMAAGERWNSDHPAAGKP